MKKPKYIEKLYALIFLCLGSSFLIMGLLCFVGIAKPTAHSSIQDPIVMGTIFSLLGVTFCIVQTVLIVINSAKKKLHNELLASGTKLNGTIDKVYLQKYTHYGNKSPFKICYTYTYQGEIYHHKSCLLWDKPNFKEGASIMVYANDLGKSTIKY